MTTRSLLFRSPKRLIDAGAGDMLPKSVDVGSFNRKTPRRTTVCQALIVAGLIAVVLTLFQTVPSWRAPPVMPKVARSLLSDDLILTSYSYFEKDSIQLANFQFFISVGMGVSSTYRSPSNTHFVVIVNGPQCTPCKSLSHAAAASSSTTA